MAQVAVIGAGPAGLAAAAALSRAGVRVDVIEAGDSVGGMARSFELWGQRVDLGPHRFFTSDRRIQGFWDSFIKEDRRIVDRITRIRFGGAFYQYPLEPFETLARLGMVEAVRCVGSYLHARIFSGELDLERMDGWLVSRFGRRLYERFFETYSEKLWGIRCRDLSADFAAQRIKEFSLFEAVTHALRPRGRKTKHKTLAEQFFYPATGSGLLYERMAECVVEAGGRILLRTPAIGPRVHNGAVTGVALADGTVIEAEHVISTMPLTSLVHSLQEPPIAVVDAARSLRFRNTILIYLHVESVSLFPDQWLYVHDPNVRIGRVTNFRNWTPELIGDSQATVLACEIWCNDDDPLWSAEEDRLVALAEAETRRLGLLGEARVTRGKVVRVNRCYPVYDVGYREKVRVIAEYLDHIARLHVIGRGGSFKYNNQDHSLLMGMLVADRILGVASPDLWSLNDGGGYQEAAKIDPGGVRR